MKSCLPNNFNPIHACLIPKTNNADIVELYRPMSLANLLFKIITKIIAERLSSIASELLSPQQTTFKNF